MLNLILDTNIYRSDINRESAAFKTIEPLLKKSTIKLHIPFFVESEFTSFLNEQCEENILKISQGINWLLRVGYLNESEKISLMNDKLKKEKIATHMKFSFQNWIREVKAATYKLEHTDCQRAISSYFEGRPPHTKKRDRE